jgi:polar amino acid transport system substrate-binding protein
MTTRLICWLILMLSVGTSLAEGRYCDRPIRVALFEYGVLYRSDTGDGIDAKLIELLAKRTQCKVEYVVMPRARIWQELERGTLDMATAAIPTAERKQYGYLLPYFRARNRVVLRGDAPPAWQTPQGFEASQAKFGVVRGFRHEPAADALIETLRAQGRVVEAVDVPENLRLLQQRVVDAVFMQPVVYGSYLSKQELKSFKVLDWVPQEQESVGALILSKRSFSKAQAQQWDAQVAKFLSDGSMLQISRKYLPDRQARDSLYRGARPQDF